MPSLDEVVQDIGRRVPISSEPYERAKAIYEWMGEHLTYDRERQVAVQSGRDNRRVLHPEYVLRERKGICGDLSGVYVALGRKLGLETKYARVSLNERGEETNHACAIVELPDRIMQVDPANRVFDASHREYHIERIDIIEDIVRGARIPTTTYQPPCTTPYVPWRRKCRTLLPRWIKRIVLCAALAYAGHKGWQWYKRPTLDVLDLQNELRFATKHGEVKFTIASDGAQQWKEALFFLEEQEGNFDEHSLLEKYVLADKNQDDIISGSEARDALAAARAKYLKSR
jgi:hypothetical protein